MFSEEEKVEASTIVKEESKKEGKWFTLLTSLFPVILRVLEKSLEAYLKKRGWV